MLPVRSLPWEAQGWCWTHFQLMLAGAAQDKKLVQSSSLGLLSHAMWSFWSTNIFQYAWNFLFLRCFFFHFLCLNVIVRVGSFFNLTAAHSPPHTCMLLWRQVNDFPSVDSFKRRRIWMFSSGTAVAFSTAKALSCALDINKGLW